MYQRIRRIGDSGSALVATVAVAFIGIAFSLIVVTQAIKATNDAARDRVRTVEVHAAEAAIDSSFRTLETTTPCETTMSVGEGSYAVDVTVAIQYYDTAGLQTGVPLVCTDGTLSGVPIQAVLTSDAVPVNETAGGLPPERRMMATVNLVPIEEPSLGVAIFSGGTMAVANSGTVTPLDPNDPARIWVENDDFVCNNSFVLDADLIVTDGSITMNNTCRITGGAWAKTGISANNNASPFRIGGDVVVYKGNLSGSGTQKFGGTISVDGAITVAYTAVGAVCSETPGPSCPKPLPFYSARGLPVVEYTPGDWPDFDKKDLAQFAQDVIDGAGITKASSITSIKNSPCSLNNLIKNPINFTGTDTVYDLTSCSPFETNNIITFVIYADTAFFVNGFQANNSFTIKSGDGDTHNVWFITPTSLTGDIRMSNSSSVIDPIHVFLFTPSSLSFANSQTMVGQAYAMEVYGNNSLDFQYTGIGIPGVELSDPTTGTAPAGYSIEIVSKHEITN